MRDARGALMPLADLEAGPCRQSLAGLDPQRAARRGGRCRRRSRGRSARGSRSPAGRRRPAARGGSPRGRGWSRGRGAAADPRRRPYPRPRRPMQGAATRIVPGRACDSAPVTTGDPEPARATGSTDGGDHRGVGPALYRERLWPGPWVWIAAAGVAASLGIAYGAAFGPVGGWAIGAAVAAAAVLVIWRTSVTVIVGEDGVRADRASLPWWATGQVLVLDAAGVRHARGPRRGSDRLLRDARRGRSWRAGHRGHRSRGSARHVADRQPRRRGDGSRDPASPWQADAMNSPSTSSDSSSERPTPRGPWASPSHQSSPWARRGAPARRW